MGRTNDTPTQIRPVLRALDGGRAGAGGGKRARASDAGARDRADGGSSGECVVSRGAVRAGDRHEPWTLVVGDAVHALAGSAYAMGIDFELAGRLALECALVCDDLRAAGVEPASLDAVAAAQPVEGQLDAAASAYLRRLTQRPGAERRELGDAVTLGLPVRLGARLLRADLDALVASADLARAVTWEIAAVLTGRTMSEWAPLAALRSR